MNIRKMKKQLKRDFLTLPFIRCYDSVSVRIGYDKTTNTSKIGHHPFGWTTQ